MRYMGLTTEYVEAELTKVLPSKFALVFDGWTCEESTTHYLAVSASFLGDDEKPETALLAFTPFEDESSFTASDHKETLVSNFGALPKNSRERCLLDRRQLSSQSKVGS